MTYKEALEEVLNSCEVVNHDAVEKLIELVERAEATCRDCKWYDLEDFRFRGFHRCTNPEFIRKDEMMQYKVASAKACKKGFERRCK